LNGCLTGLISRVGLLRNVHSHSRGDIYSLGPLDRVAQTMTNAILCIFHQQRHHRQNRSQRRDRQPAQRCPHSIAERDFGSFYRVLLLLHRSDPYSDIG
jgi:hypothetical protein